MDLLKIGLVSDKIDAYALRDAADWVIKPRLLAVPGVAHVIVFGGNVRQIQIQPDMQQLCELRHHADRRCRCGARRAAAARRRIHRHRQPARADAIADPGARYRAISGKAVVAVRNGVPIRCAMSPR